jgi:hypothetical protein
MRCSSCISASVTLTDFMAREEEEGADEEEKSARRAAAPSKSCRSCSGDQVSSPVSSLHSTAAAEDVAMVRAGEEGFLRSRRDIGDVGEVPKRLR